MADPKSQPQDGEKRRDTRRLTATSDLGSVSASVKAAQLEKKQAQWILENATDDINLHYTLGDQIGQPGQFGRAVKAVHKTTGDARAVKIVSKTKFTRTADKKVHFKELRLEIDILRQMDHENIVKLYDVFETLTELFIVMEVCKGGELFDRIKAQPAGSYCEKDAQQILRQICTGLSHLHARKIVHCDLKPDNFLFVDAAKDSRLKIIDFGMSKFVKRRQYFHSLRGTPYYIAPEVIKGQYNEAVDMWSFGVVMFVMLFGYPPFHADSDQEIFRLVLEGFTPVVKKGYKAHFPQSIPCSDSGKDLIAKLLTIDTAKRLTADEALEHPWLTGESANGAPMVMDVLTNLKNFSSHSKFKQDILALMVNTLTEQDLVKLKKLFTEIDADGNGHITVAELAAAVEKSNSYAAGLTGGSGTSSTGMKFTPAELQKILEAADMDGDGTLSYNELVLTTVQRKLSAKEERLWIAFSKIDLNRDGLLTIEELSSVLGEDIAEASQMIKSVDKVSPSINNFVLVEIEVNGDGVIDFDEFLDLWLKREEGEQKQLLGTIAEDPTKQQEAPDLPPGANFKAKK